MSHYVIKHYGLECDVCDASEEHTPMPDEPRKLANTRIELGKRGWMCIGGCDICPNRDAAHEAARTRP